jgi:hypothetical protein
MAMPRISLIISLVILFACVILLSVTSAAYATAEYTEVSRSEVNFVSSIGRVKLNCQ